jgi:hypothetical protein
MQSLGRLGKGVVAFQILPTISDRYLGRGERQHWVGQIDELDDSFWPILLKNSTYSCLEFDAGV